MKVPVISIGNITVGGSGKTPLVDLLASSLSNHSLAILSRGYKATSKKEKIIFPYQNLTEWKEIGDECFMLHKNHPSIFLGVGKNRKKNAAALIDKVDLFLLDDGLQHRKIERDLELICVDPKKSIVQEEFLPLGALRDLPQRLQKADYIFVTGTKTEWERVEREIRTFTKTPLIGFSPRVEFFSSSTKIEQPQKPIWLFAAIANPERIAETLTNQKVFVQKKIYKADHEIFSEKELRRLFQEAEKEGAILCCSEKDAIKYENSQIPFLYTKLHLTITQGEEHWKKMIEKISSLVRQLR